MTVKYKMYFVGPNPDTEAIFYSIADLVGVGVQEVRSDGDSVIVSGEYTNEQWSQIDTLF